MMSDLNIQDLGGIIRKVRKERGLRLEDLADDHISPATISNIERGVPHVKQDRAFYLLKKLNIKLDEIPVLLMSKQRELEGLEFQLFSIETLRDNGEADKALYQLEQIQLEESHPYAATCYYLKGKCYNSMEKWKKAERSFFNAIRCVHLNPFNQKSNIEAASFTELGLCMYGQNDLPQALQFTESGLDAFVHDGERQQFYPILLLNKALYLDKLNRTNEALRLMEEHWESIRSIQHLEALLRFYCLRAEILRKNGLYEEAILYAREGLEKARLDRKYNCIYDLWTILGSVYVMKEEWEKAEVCFDNALSLQEKSTDKKVFTTTYTRLGILYMRQEKWEEAQTKIEQGIQNGTQHHDALRLADAYLAMGNLFYRQGILEKANHYYGLMLQLVQKHRLNGKEYVAYFKWVRTTNHVDKEEFDLYLKKMMADCFDKLE